MSVKKIGKVLTSKSVGTGPASYEKRIYRAAVSQRLRNTALDYVACGLLSSECYVKVNDSSDFWNVLACCQRNVWFVKLAKNVLFFFVNVESFFFFFNER